MPGRYECAGLILLSAALGVGCENAPVGMTPVPSGQSQPVKFVGFDANSTLVEALQQGKMQGLVLQNPYQMGDLGVRTVVVHLDQGEVKRWIGTGEKLAMRENLTNPAIDKLLHPPRAAEGSDTGDSGPKTKDTGDSGPKTKKYRVLIIPKATANEYWQTVHAGAIKVTEELGNVELLWRGPKKEDDYTKQIELIESATALGVDGIVLAPIDSKALASPVEAVIERGIPVVVIDSGLEAPKTLSFVATDNYHGGVLAAKRMSELLGGKGNVIVLRHMVGSNSTEQREQGFLETIARYPEIKVLSQNQYAGATVETAQQAAQTLIKNYRDQVGGIFCSNEQSTAGMLKALEEAGMLKREESATTSPAGGTKKAP
jgi:ribose transport system substrate-binding protein